MGWQALALAATLRNKYVNSITYVFVSEKEFWHEACLSGLQTYVVWVGVG